MGVDDVGLEPHGGGHRVNDIHRVLELWVRQEREGPVTPDLGAVEFRDRRYLAGGEHRYAVAQAGQHPVIIPDRVHDAVDLRVKRIGKNGDLQTGIPSISDL